MSLISENIGSVQSMGLLRDSTIPPRKGCEQGRSLFLFGNNFDYEEYSAAVIFWKTGDIRSVFEKAYTLSLLYWPNAHARKRLRLGRFAAFFFLANNKKRRSERAASFYFYRSHADHGKKPSCELAPGKLARFGKTAFNVGVSCARPNHFARTAAY